MSSFIGIPFLTLDQIFFIGEKLLVIVLIIILAITKKKELKIWPFIVGDAFYSIFSYRTILDMYIIRENPKSFFAVEMALVIISITISLIQTRKKGK